MEVGSLTVVSDRAESLQTVQGLEEILGDFFLAGRLSVFGRFQSPALQKMFLIFVLRLGFVS